MKQTLNLSTATLRMPKVSDPTKWKSAGDPRPIIRLADGTDMQIVCEEMTPFTVSMNGVAITNDGTGTPTAYSQATVDPGPLTMTIEPTSPFPERYYRHETINGLPRRLQKEKAQLSLPASWSMDLSKPPNTRYRLSYWMNFAADFESPPTDNHYCLILQGWQGAVKHPPLQLGVIKQLDHGYQRLRLMAEDDSTEIEPRDSKLVGDTFLFMDEWQKLVFDLQPNYVNQGGEGIIGLTVNDVPVFDWRGDWGYKPGGADNRTPKIGLGVGIYRMTQPKRQTVSFKQFKFEVMT